MACHIRELVAVVGTLALTASMAACGNGSGDSSSDGDTSVAKEATSYTVSYAAGGGDAYPDYQFLKNNAVSDSGDSRQHLDVTLTIDGDGGYTLVSESYTSDGSERYEIGDDTGIALVLVSTSKGNVADQNGDTISIEAPTGIDYVLKTDLYSSQLTSALDLSYNDDDSDGEWTLDDTPELAGIVPATTFTVDPSDGSIVSWERSTD